MPTPRTRPASLATWTAAADQADHLPDDRLPCPGCAASLKGRNLADHVRRSHMADDRSRRGPDRAPLVGLDRRIRTTGRVVVLLWVAAVVGLGRTFPDSDVATDATATLDAAAETGGPTFALMRPHLAAIARSPLGLVTLGGIGVIVLALLAGRAGLFRARVEVRDRDVVLRHRLGTGTRRTPLPAPVETGSLIRRVSEGGGEEGGGGDTYDVHMGTYLRLGRGRRAITVGCPTSTHVRKHWEGFAPGRQLTRWDITLAPAEFVAFQYALSARGVIAPRAS